MPGSSALMSRSGPNAPQTVALMPAAISRSRMRAGSIVSGFSTQISIRSKPIPATLSMRSSVSFEKGDTQMNVLAPNRIGRSPTLKSAMEPRCRSSICSLGYFLPPQRSGYPGSSSQPHSA